MCALAITTPGDHPLKLTTSCFQIRLRASHTDRPTDQPLSLPTSTRSVSIRVMFHVRVDLYYNHYYRYQSFSWAFSRLIRRSHARTARPPALTGRYQDDQNGTAPPVPSRPRITAATKRPD